jgi:hypothetical protein
MSPARLRFWILLIAAAATTARVPASAFQDPKKPADRHYAVAAVRADGTIIPFAEYRDRRWRDFWTGTEDGGISVPITLDAIDEDWWGKLGPALKWWHWIRPSVAEAMTVAGPRPVSTPCSVEVGLETDFKPGEGLPAREETPYPKAGLATTASIDFAPIPLVPEGDTDWVRVRDAVDREFPLAEDFALGFMQWKHPVPERIRNRGAIDLQRVWHVRDSRFFYFEAMRRYPDLDPPEGQPPCDLVTYVAGYLWEERSEKLRPVNVRALISYCHMEQAAFLWPLGTIREGSKQFWVLQSAGWTGEFYGIVEPVPARGEVRQHVWHTAGQCEW